MSFNLGDNVIDSRDIIKRLEELRDQKMPLIRAGWNMPGYMPDNEPADFESFEDAREYIADEIEREADQIDEAREMVDTEDGSDDAAEAQALRDAAKEIRDGDGELGITLGQYHYWITDTGDTQGLDDDEIEELLILEEVDSEVSGYTSDWKYGVTLVRDDYFERYAQEFADEIGAIDANAGWPNSCIDWERAARELQMDYISVEIDGTTYWYRG